jgi:cytochrome bd ubiquinol oxidase subunit I
VLFHGRVTLLLARWQFAVVTVFHFFIVPVTIGLCFLVAVMQTLAYRRADPDWDRLSRFFGRLFLISMAVGVVTGIVLEFQFGLNWSSYSVFVGNIFGAPLAIEGLLAFFLESTFVGLWIFGRGRLSPRLHLATIWITSFGTVLSAFFILAANAWMQHPVGYTIVHGQAVLTDFWAVLGNSTLWESFAHTVLGAFATGGALVLGISLWRSHRDAAGAAGGDDPSAATACSGQRAPRSPFQRAARLAAVFTFVTVVLTAVAGDAQARLMDSQQPMKMAAAEALYHTSDGASFSLLTIGNLSGSPVFQIRVPHVLSLIADLSWNGQVRGIDDVQTAEATKYGPGSYVPVIWLTYWSFRAMVGAGMLMILVSGWAIWGTRRRRWREGRWLRRIAMIGMLLPFVANSTGWIFTEAGRQPWIVYGLMTTAKGVSSVTAADVGATLIAFVVVYMALGATAIVLMTRAARRGLDEQEEDDEHGELVPGLVY